MGEGTISTQVFANAEEGETFGAPSHIIKRPRLTKILDETEARIILLCAPAGYGKTTLAREWIATRREPVLWYAGGPAMADVAALAVDLAELFAPDDDDFISRIRTVAVRSNEAKRLARLLGEHVPGGRAILVIDDFHHVFSSPEAEALIREVAAHSAFRLLLTSRERPTWIDSRSVVYGDSIVIGNDLLAMTDAEANAVLPNGGTLIVQAEGWPAVIGLAATRNPRAELSAHTSPAELFDYVASELFSSTDSKTQEALYVLALSGRVNRTLASELLGPDFETLLLAVCTKGFASQQSGEISIHPLLRTFFFDQLSDTPHADKVVEEVVSVLRRHGRWDECLQAVSRFPNGAVAASALREALIPLIDSGRTSTVESWCQVAAMHRFADPIFRLARAEVALRRGRDVEAEALASEAANSLVGDLAARAHLTTARGALQAGNLGITFAEALRADEIAESPELKTEALWVAAASAYEQEPSRMLEFASRLEAVDDPRPEHSLRVAGARLFVHMGSGGSFKAAVAKAERVVALSNEVRDPLLRTNARHVYAHVLRATGAYETALSAAEDLIVEAQETGLEFVVDHALLTKAAALICVRSFGGAKKILRELRAREEQVSSHIRANVAVQEARLRIGTGDLDGASLILDKPTALHTLGMESEFVALQALVAAALGRDELARRFVCRVQAGPLMNYGEGGSYVRLAEAILDVRSTEDVKRAAAALCSAIEAGSCDHAVTACRAYPRLAVLAVTGGAAREVEALLSASRDTAIGRKAGLGMPREYRRARGLSPRETEVYELLVQGRTNTEIATTLFISASTTKVHIRHIFEKLGVHTRAEAAAASADLTRPD